MFIWVVTLAVLSLGTVSSEEICKPLPPRPKCPTLGESIPLTAVPNCPLCHPRLYHMYICSDKIDDCAQYGIPCQMLKTGKLGVCCHDKVWGALSNDKQKNTFRSIRRAERAIMSLTGSVVWQSLHPILKQILVQLKLCNPENFKEMFAKLWKIDFYGRGGKLIAEAFSKTDWAKENPEAAEDMEKHLLKIPRRKSIDKMGLKNVMK